MRMVERLEVGWHTYPNASRVYEYRGSEDTELPTPQSIRLSRVRELVRELEMQQRMWRLVAEMELTEK